MSGQLSRTQICIWKGLCVDPADTGPDSMYKTKFLVFTNETKFRSGSIRDVACFGGHHSGFMFKRAIYHLGRELYYCGYYTADHMITNVASSLRESAAHSFWAIKMDLFELCWNPGLA